MWINRAGFIKKLSIFIVFIGLLTYLLSYKIKREETKVDREWKNLEFKFRGFLSEDLNWEDDLGKRYFPKEITRKMGFVIVFRFRETDCSICYQSYLNYLRRNKLLSPQSNIIIVTSSSNERFIYFLRKENNLGHGITILKSKPMPLDSLNRPYFVVIDRKSKIVDGYVDNYDANRANQAIQRFMQKFQRNNDL